MENPDKDGQYNCPKCSNRKKDPYPENKIDQACARCIRKHYNLSENPS